ncbi:MAG: DUF1501 domain-containing protein [Planctomycetaceae bacterium]
MILPFDPHSLLRSRRAFLTSAASGVGSVALASLLRDDGVLAASPAGDASSAAEDLARLAGSLAPRRPHHPPTANACILIFLAGGPSQVDLFDPKPELAKHAGKPLPDSMTAGVRFAFIKRDAKLRPSEYRFQKHGECGMELSELLPHLAECVDDIAFIRSTHTDVFNHLPGHLMMGTGVEQFGRPSVGAWVLYGLGSESRNLPGYVALTSQSLVRGGGANWGNGFLPPTYQGVHFHSQGDPVLNLTSPPGVTPEVQRASLDAASEMNRLRFEQTHDPEIASRIAAYEMAFNMQVAAPELIDISGETRATVDAYGVNRTGLQEVVASAHGKHREVSRTFSRNCLLARRLVERGVRFVSIFHGDWDHHDTLDAKLRQTTEGVDRPIAALLKDLKQRGLLDTTLVAWVSEFGRTPLGQGKDGRDHHPIAFTTWLAGGGVKGGRTIGVTDEFGWRIVEAPVHVHDLHATMLHLFGLDHLRLTHRFQGRDFRLTDVAGKLVPGLL